MGYLEREWRKLQLYAGLPIIVALIPIVLIPESPRWLLAIGKSEKAEQVMRKIAKCNGKLFFYVVCLHQSINGHSKGRSTEF